MSTCQSVEAAPFAAHLRHICAITRLPWPVLALAAEVPLEWGDALVNGTKGRPLQTFPIPLAERIMSLSPDISSRLANRWVPAAGTARLLRQMLRSGWHPPALAHHCGLSLAELSSILRGAPEVTNLVELRVRALSASHRRRSARVAA